MVERIDVSGFSNASDDVIEKVGLYITKIISQYEQIKNLEDIRFKLLIKTIHNNTTLLSFTTSIYVRNSRYVCFDIVSKRFLSYKASRTKNENTEDNLYRYISYNEEEIKQLLCNYLHDEVPLAIKNAKNFWLDIMCYDDSNTFVDLESYNYILLK